MSEDRVDDVEQLYRRVANNPHLFSMVNGKLRLSSSAFNDSSADKSKREPSVDRARLKNNDPNQAKTNITQGIVGFIAGDARVISTVKTTDAKGVVVTTHAVDVVPDPLKENAAHALVTATPNITSNKPFERLKDALCRLAEKGGWLVDPS